MVTSTGEIFAQEDIFNEISQKDIHWSTVSLSEVIDRDFRLEASVFNIRGKHAKEVVENCKWPIRRLFGDNSFIENAFYPGRFKRVYVDENCEKAVGFLGSSEMLDVRPIPEKYLLPNKTDIPKLSVEEDYILLSRSGTIGNLTYVSKTLKRFLISEHAIRIICKEYPGYIYTFMKSDIGQALIKSNTYGAVVDQIEPDHLKNVFVPDPDPKIKQQIHQLIKNSYFLRDQSNILIDEAQKLLISELQLPPIHELECEKFVPDHEIKNYSVKLSDLDMRLDGSYHVPITSSIISHINKYADEVVNLGNERISKQIILPGRFKRVYVEEGQGVVFFGGKQLYELDPSNKKYLSLSHHKKRIAEQLTLKEKMILITCSGTIGKVNIVPHHWNGWTANQHILRVIPADENIAGYIYTWLSSKYGYELINRFTYGAVVDEIDDKQLGKVQIPLLKNKDIQNKINNLVLEANKKRSEAYILEQEALQIMNDLVYQVK